MRFLLAALFCSASCSEPKPAAKEIPTYHTLHRTNFKGSFFHFDHEGDLFVACSKHQGNNAPGTKLVRHGTEEFVTLGKEIHQQKDLRVLKFDSDTIGEKTALPYHAKPSVKQGDQVVILNRGEKIQGVIRQSPTVKNHHYYLETDSPFSADGMSGSPVFSVRLGTVVGVLQVANHKTKATIGGFELLEMP